MFAPKKAELQALEKKSLVPWEHTYTCKHTHTSLYLNKVAGPSPVLLSNQERPDDTKRRFKNDLEAAVETRLLDNCTSRSNPSTIRSPFQNYPAPASSDAEDC